MRRIVMKKVFRLPTTSNSNASHNQAEEVRAWVVSVMKQIAQNSGSERGPTVDIIVEIVE